MKWVKNNDDSSVIERELDAVASHIGQPPQGGNEGGSNAGDAESSKKACMVICCAFLAVTGFVAVLFAVLFVLGYSESNKQYEYA